MLLLEEDEGLYLPWKRPIEARHWAKSTIIELNFSRELFEELFSKQWKYSKRLLGVASVLITYTVILKFSFVKKFSELPADIEKCSD